METDWVTKFFNEELNLSSYLQPGLSSYDSIELQIQTLVEQITDCINTILKGGRPDLLANFERPNDLFMARYFLSLFLQKVQQVQGHQ